MDPNQFGDEVFRLIATNLKNLGLSNAVFESVFGGFWDLYCKKPASADILPKKLDGFI